MSERLFPSEGQSRAQISRLNAEAPRCRSRRRNKLVAGSALYETVRRHLLYPPWSPEQIASSITVPDHLRILHRPEDIPEDI